LTEPPSAPAPLRRFEFVGLPGSGKTTLLRGWDPGLGILTVPQLIRRARLATATDHTRRQLLRRLPESLRLRLLRGPEPDTYDVARFTVDHPDLHEAVTAAARRVPDEDDRLVALWMLFDAWARHAFVDRVAGPGEGVIVDEGLWQRLAFLTAASGSTLLPSAASAPLPHGLVVFRLPLEVAARRVRDRGDEFQAVHHLPAMAERLEATEAHLRGLGVATLAVDATRPRATSLSAVRRFVAAEMAR
jgi:hypothetical protein